MMPQFLPFYETVNTFSIIPIIASAPGISLSIMDYTILQFMRTIEWTDLELLMVKSMVYFV